MVDLWMEDRSVTESVADTYAKPAATDATISINVTSTLTVVCMNSQPCHAIVHEAHHCVCVKNPIMGKDASPVVELDLIVVIIVTWHGRGKIM